MIYPVSDREDKTIPCSLSSPPRIAHKRKYNPREKKKANLAKVNSISLHISSFCKPQNTYLHM